MEKYKNLVFNRNDRHILKSRQLIFLHIYTYKMSVCLSVCHPPLPSPRGVFVGQWGNL